MTENSRFLTYLTQNSRFSASFWLFFALCLPLAALLCVFQALLLGFCSVFDPFSASICVKPGLA